MTDLKSTPVLLLSGAADPMVRPAARDRLAAGHNLTQQNLALAAQLLQAFGLQAFGLKAFGLEQLK
jgi:hypothetical protein